MENLEFHPAATLFPLKEEEVPESLPDTIKDMAAIIGFENALKIVENFGGTRFFIPKKMRDRKTTNRIVSLIGKEATLDFIAEYGGETIGIPGLKLRVCVPGSQI